MKSIKEIKFYLCERTTLSMSADAVILSVHAGEATNGGPASIFILGDESLPWINREISALRTGSYLPTGCPGIFVGTIIVNTWESWQLFAS